MELRRQRVLFCRKMEAHVAEGREIIYIDETTFHLWMQPARVWIKKGMKVQLPDLRGQSISMIGALSVKHGLLLTQIFLGTNTVD